MEKMAKKIKSNCIKKIDRVTSRDVGSTVQEVDLPDVTTDKTRKFLRNKVVTRKKVIGGENYDALVLAGMQIVVESLFLEGFGM